MSQNCIYLFALSFTAGNEAGLALVSAETASDALVTLKNGGKYNGVPDAYSLVQSLQLGVYTENRYELLLEMYTNALVAFDALVAYYSHLSLYNFPEGGIPYTDLSIQVQNILNRINELTVATTTADGLMSSADKIKLNGVESGAERNAIENIKVNGVLQPIDSNRVANISIEGTVPDDIVLWEEYNGESIPVSGQSEGSSSSSPSSGGTASLSDDIKDAILACFQRVAWTTASGQDYYDTLHDLFYPPRTLTSISAVFTQSGTVYNDATLDSLKSALVVTAHYDDNTSAVISSGYTLSGTLTAGTSTVTVTYQSKTTTFSVTVTARPTVSSITATYTQSGTVYTTDSLDSLKSNLVVKAVYTDNTEDTLNESDYTLSGTLTAGASTITVTFQTFTTTFTVTVTAVTLSSISAVFTQSGAVYTDASLDSLKSGLVVTASYNNGTTATVASADYTLSGTLTAGTSTVTVTYSGVTTTFTVTVSQAESWDYNWVAATSNHTAPTGMTQYSGYTPVWGTNDEYYEVKDPRLQGATQSGLEGDIVVEIEMKWVEQGSYSAGSTLVVSSAEKTGCKIFLANSSGNVNLYSAPSSGGNYALKTIGTDWNNFHKYRFELVGDLCKTYIDGVLVDTGYTYYSSWNGYPIIWSENQGSGRSHWAIKSIKYRMISNS